jgi:hypothetical protein
LYGQLLVSDDFYMSALKPVSNADHCCSGALLSLKDMLVIGGPPNTVSILQIGGCFETRSTALRVIGSMPITNGAWIGRLRFLFHR